MPGSVVPQPQPTEAGSRGKLQRKQQAPLFALAGAECGWGEPTRRLCPVPGRYLTRVGPPGRTAPQPRVPHAPRGMAARRQGLARPRAWGRGRWAGSATASARPAAGGSHCRARTRQINTACLMNESSGTGSREGASGGAGVQQPRGQLRSRAVPSRTAAPLPRCRSLPFSGRELQSFTQRCAVLVPEPVPVPEAGCLRLRRSGPGEPPSGVPPACFRPGLAPAPRRQYGASPLPAFAPAAGRRWPHSLHPAPSLRCLCAQLCPELLPCPLARAHSLGPLTLETLQS